MNDFSWIEVDSHHSFQLQLILLVTVFPQSSYSSTGFLTDLCVSVLTPIGKNPYPRKYNNSEDIPFLDGSDEPWAELPLGVESLYPESSQIALGPSLIPKPGKSRELLIIPVKTAAGSSQQESTQVGTFMVEYTNGYLYYQQTARNWSILPMNCQQYDPTYPHSIILLCADE